MITDLNPILDHLQNMGLLEKFQRDDFAKVFMLNISKISELPLDKRDEFVYYMAVKFDNDF